MRRAVLGWILAAVLGAGLASRAVEAQAPVPESALRGQNPTPKPPPLPPAVQREAELSRLHHAAQREVELGDLAASGGASADLRSYGSGLASRFRAFDRRVVALGERRGVAASALTQTYAGENTDSLRREADDLARLGAVHGADFDRAFWVALAQEQSAAADLAATSSTSANDGAVRALAAELAMELDAASREAVAAARPATPPAAK
jgi:hypothetical protein